MMYIIQLLAVLLIAISKASTRAVLQDQHQWRKPTAEDARSPCPALNVLANHGYLPHNGKAISVSMINQSLTDVYNIEPIFAGNFGQAAVYVVTNITLPKSLNILIDLDALNRHSITWNDASLTHNDFVQGGNHSLQPALLDALLNDSPTDFLTAASLARSRVRRESDSLTAGSKRALDWRGRVQAYSKAALILQILGGVAHGTANASASANTTLADLAAPKAAVREWFADERLPSSYVRPAKVISPLSTLDVAVIISNITRKISGVGSGSAAAAGSVSGGSVPAGMQRLFG